MWAERRSVAKEPKGWGTGGVMAQQHSIAGIWVQNNTGKKCRLQIQQVVRGLVTDF